jgi:hypothetical protein
MFSIFRKVQTKFQICDIRLRWKIHEKEMIELTASLLKLNHTHPTFGGAFLTSVQWLGGNLLHDDELANSSVR